MPLWPGVGADEILYAPTEELADSVVLVGHLRAHAVPNAARRRRKHRLEDVEAVDLYGGHESLLVRTALIRSERYDPEKTPYLGTFDAVCEVLRHLVYADQEYLITIALTAKNRAIAIHEAGVGGTFGIAQQPRHVLKVAMLTGASAMIVAHNHPSGDPSPSPEDMEMTGDLLQASRVLGIQVLDHVIVARDGCTSLREMVDFEKYGRPSDPLGRRLGIDR